MTARSLKIVNETGDELFEQREEIEDGADAAGDSDRKDAVKEKNLAGGDETSPVRYKGNFLLIHDVDKRLETLSNSLKDRLEN